MAKSAIDRIKELDEERSQIFDQAKEEALEKANEAVAALNSLGLEYRLMNGAEPGPRITKAPGKASGNSSKGMVRDAPCSVCGFKTSPPHDARAHRGQTKKKVFTAAELSDKGFSKVGYN